MGHRFGTGNPTAMNTSLSQRNAKLNLDKACLRSSKKNRETVSNINENHMYYFVCCFFFPVRIVSHTYRAHLTQAYCSLGIARGIKRQGKKGGFLSIIRSQSCRCWAVLAAEGTLCQLCTLCRRILFVTAPKLHCHGNASLICYCSSRYLRLENTSSLQVFFSYTNINHVT